MHWHDLLPSLKFFWVDWAVTHSRIWGYLLACSRVFIDLILAWTDYKVRGSFGTMRTVASRECGRTLTRDPLPGLREVVAGLSNDQAHAHFRRTRPVVYNLRDTTINLNTELRALVRLKDVRLKDALQKTLAEVTRNLKVNSETQQMRQRRPTKEKVGTITITVTKIIRREQADKTVICDLACDMLSFGFLRHV